MEERYSCKPENKLLSQVNIKKLFIISGKKQIVEYPNVRNENNWMVNIQLPQYNLRKTFKFRRTN